MKNSPTLDEVGPARGYLDGQMLIAMPAMSDERFARTVIYVCAHSTEGAMGIIVNQPAQNIKFPDLLVQLEVIPATERIQLCRDRCAVFNGGDARESQRELLQRRLSRILDGASNDQRHAGSGSRAGIRRLGAILTHEADRV